jgi:hypothetical protein
VATQNKNVIYAHSQGINNIKSSMGFKFRAAMKKLIDSFSKNRRKL